MSNLDVIYPRAFAALSASINGEQVDTGIEPSRVTWTVRQHNQAGTAELVVLGSALPFQPETVDGVYVTLFAADVGGFGNEVRQPQWRRFVGYVDELEKIEDEHGPSVELKCRDLSALYRDFHPVPQTARPRYSDTLATALQAILDAVPNTFNANGTRRVTLRQTPALAGVGLAQAVHARAATARVELPAEVTAWAAMEHLCGLCNKLISVELDEVVVRDPAQSFASDAAPVHRFVYGDADADTLSVNRTKKFARNRRGIKVTSYSPERRVLEAVYPPDAELARLVRPASHVGGTALGSGSGRGTRSGGAGASRDAEREVVAAPNGITTQAALDAFAQRVYTERSRQELEGKLVTPRWSDAILGLHNGDRFAVAIQPTLEAELRACGADDTRAIALLGRRLGLEPDAARVLVAATRAARQQVYYLRSATHELADQRAQSTLEFANLITIGEN